MLQWIHQSGYALVTGRGQGVLVHVDVGDHGCIETRTYTAIHDTAGLQERHDWPRLQGVVMVESVRESGDKTERETRFYITSLTRRAIQLGPIIRSHCSVENSLHWVRT